MLKHGVDFRFSTNSGYRYYARAVKSEEGDFDIFQDGDEDSGAEQHQVWPMDECEDCVRRGVWYKVEPVEPEVQPEVVEGTKITFYYIGYDKATFTAEQTEEGDFKVLWGGPLNTVVYYTVDQVKGFITSGTWVVVGVS